MSMAGRDAVGVGIVGLSAERGWAAQAHVPALRAVPGFEIRACSASSLDSAKAAAAAHDVPQPCADHIDLAGRPDVDLVVIAVKVPEHHRLVSAAIEAGKSVLCEWPLGNGSAEAEDLTRRAAAAGVTGHVGLQARSAPAVRAVRGAVRSGVIGEVLSTTLVGTGGMWGDTVDGPNAYLTDRHNGATLLSIPFGHTIDAVCHTLGNFTDLVATTATRRTRVRRTDTDELVPMTAEDQIAVSGTLEGGVVLSAHYRGGTAGGENFRWTITGTEGELVLTGPTGHLQFGLVEVTCSDGGAMRPYEIPQELRRTDSDPRARWNPVAEAYAELLVALRGGPSAVPTFADAVARHRLLDAIVESAGTGRRVSPVSC